MVRADEARGHHAARGVEHGVTRRSGDRADLGDAPIRDADIAAGALQRARAAGQDADRAADHGGAQCSSPPAPCQRSASRLSPAIASAIATPASVIRNSAANIRGTSSWKPA